MITNVKNPKERDRLREIALVYEESIIEVGCPCDRILVLDPQASRPLEPEDFKGVDFVVVGGIMGDHPPKGRTRKLLTSRLPGCKARNIGEHQFSVDGAMYVAMMVSKGLTLEEIPIKVGLEIKVDEYLTIELPYAYPLVSGRPLISQELIEYLVHDIEDDEVYAIRTGKIRSVADY